MLGRRVPDLDLTTPVGDVRLVTLLHAARPVLLDLGDHPDLAATTTGWHDRVALVCATYPKGQVTVPGIEPIETPEALLIRPDGYVVWAAPTGTAIDTTALREALTTWFGPARRTSTQ